MCEDLQDELLSLKEGGGGGTFNIHGLKDTDARIMRVLGIPSYKEFIHFVDELPLPPQQGTGILDKYNQTAAGLIHLRMGATWLFLALLFFNSSRKEKELESAAIKILSFIEVTMYFKYVHYPSFQEIMKRTSPSLLLDVVHLWTGPICMGRVVTMDPFTELCFVITNMSCNLQSFL